MQPHQHPLQHTRPHQQQQQQHQQHPLHRSQSVSMASTASITPQPPLVHQPQPPSSSSMATAVESEGRNQWKTLIDQLNNEYTTMTNEYNLCRMQRDSYEQKLEAQLAEFQSMRQTITELEMSYRNMKQQYEEQIYQLNQQLAHMQHMGGSTDMLQQQQQQQQQQPPPLPLRVHSQQNNSHTSSGVQGGFPQSSLPNPPFQQMAMPPSRGTPPAPLSMTATTAAAPGGAVGEGLPFPPVGGAQESNGNGNSAGEAVTSESSSAGIPSFNELTDRTGTKSSSNPNGDTSSGRQMPPVIITHESSRNGSPGVLTPTSINDAFRRSMQNHGTMGPATTSTTTVSPVELLDGVGSMTKREGKDWVMIFNPKIKSDITVDLSHNLDHQGVVCCVRFSNSGKHLATGCSRLAQIYDVDTGQRVQVFNIENDSSGPIAAASGDGNSNGKAISHRENLESYVRSVCFSPDDRFLATGSDDKMIKLWDMQSGSLHHSFSGHELEIYSLDFSRDGRFIVSGSGDGKAKIWSMESLACEHTLAYEDDNGQREGVTSVAISPDGRHVATGSLDHIVRLWDIATGKFLRSYRGHDNSVYSIAFSPDGKTLASGSFDTTMKLWDLSSSAGNGNQEGCITTLAGHRDYVLSVAFSRDGRWLISGSKDRSVQFWDPRGGSLHFMLQGHKNSVISVDTNPSRPMFATGSGDFRARLWRLE